MLRTVPLLSALDADFGADRTETAINGTSMQSIADDLRRSVPCTEADALYDDLAFWDAMRGFDCRDDADRTFIRVYAHAASAPQTLDDWKDTLDADRGVVRGQNWYVIGPPAVVEAVEAPESFPKIATDVGVATSLTVEQDFLTTCARYVASEGERYVRHPNKHSESAGQYEVLFPGATAELHTAIDDLGPKRIRRISDAERWNAALTPIGPRSKAACSVAYEQVSDAAQPLGSIR